MLINDKELLKRVKSSDRAAFKELFSTYQPVLFNSVMYRTHDYSLTEDIVQDTFLRVWNSRNKIRPNQSFYAWLSRISYNLFLDHIKREKVRFKHRDDIPVPAGSQYDNPESATELSFLEEQIKSAVNKYLPEKCRAIFLLSRIDGYSNKEIAVINSISIKTVENQLYKALKILRKKINVNENGV
ncbi:MAG: RNA polymerase sigma-70 factor [Candidatus Marinimicrobia bacterium]|nr:RNA polymerase sigma-70 factor [Candidatus Neomarinimicrobiota bacterium]